MPKTRCKEVYAFDELSDKAKDKARDWYREHALDYDWWDCVFDDAKTIGKFFGWTTTDIFFSGFSSQGDGACFVGSWSPATANVKDLKEYAPQDKELHRLGAEFARIEKVRTQALKTQHDETEDEVEDLYANVKHRGHYLHKYETVFETAGLDDEEDAFIKASRDFMEWIYRNLETNYEYRLADEQIDEDIRANEYEFTEDGKHYG